jgi:hypothetical protein
MLRTTVLRGNPVGLAMLRHQTTAPKLPRPIQRLPLLETYPRLVLSRSVASTVSGKPASQTFEHAATNIKEEVGNSVADLAKVIAANDPKKARDSVDPTGAGSFVCIVQFFFIIYILRGSDNYSIVGWNHETSVGRGTRTHDGVGPRR